VVLARHLDRVFDVPDDVDRHRLGVDPQIRPEDDPRNPAALGQRAPEVPDRVSSACWDEKLLAGRVAMRLAVDLELDGALYDQVLSRGRSRLARRLQPLRLLGGWNMRPL
jgi:hypothetical protein